MNPMTTNPADPTVRRIDRSPMNKKLRIVELSCGHDTVIYPGKKAPKIGSEFRCEKCDYKAKRANGEVQ